MSTRALREEIKQLRADHAEAQVKIHDLIVEQEQMTEDVKRAKEARKVADLAVEAAAKAVLKVISDGPSAAMNEFNAVNCG